MSAGNRPSQFPVRFRIVIQAAVGKLIASEKGRWFEVNVPPTTPDILAKQMLDTFEEEMKIIEAHPDHVPHQD